MNLILRSIYAVSLLASVLVLSEQSHAREDKSNSLIVIKNIAAIDARHGLRTGVDVVLRAGKIHAVGENIAAILRKSDFENFNLIDGTNKFLIPGLWDAHVHLTYDARIDHRTFFPLALAYGVTSLRDIGGQLNLLAEARRTAIQEPLTPDLYVSGPLIDGQRNVYDGHSPAYPELSVRAASAVDAMRQVDRLAAAKVDFIKAYEMLSPDVLAAVVAQADKHGLKVSAHSPLLMGARKVATSGVDDLQHLRNLELDCVSHPDMLLSKRRNLFAESTDIHGSQLRSLIHRMQRPKAVNNQDKTQCDKLIALLTENMVYQTPTLVVTTFSGYRLFARHGWRQNYALMPESVAIEWTQKATSLSSAQPAQTSLDYYAWALSMTGMLQRAGVPIMSGSDAPIGFLTPGASLHEELVLLVRAGLSPIEALAAATVTPARFFGLQDKMGLIAPGMKADLVVLRGNPLDHIENTSSVDAVFKNGIYLDRAKLDELKAMPSSLPDETRKRRSRR